MRWSFSPFDYFHNIVYLMHLIPRNFNYKVVHKRRSYRTVKAASLHFGHIGFFFTAPTILTSKHLFRFILLMKKAARRSDKTFRRYWIYLYPTLPLTRKSVGLRMGKGKGKRQTWFAQAYPGMSLFEIQNMRLGRAIHFYRQLRTRVPVPLRILSINKAYIQPYRFSKVATLSYPFR